jgi:CRP-like cAMP-binding protein
MQKKILLIEDNPDVRENVSEILALSNFEVIAAPNGRDGIDLAQKELPDLIVCDISMPLLDGFGVLNHLGLQNETSRIPFIFLTARTDRDSFRKGMELGANDFITKPFEDSELLRAIETRLKKLDFVNTQFQRTPEGFNQFISDAKALDIIINSAENTPVFTFQRKEYLYREGSQPRYVYFVESGRVKTVMISNDGKELMTGLYGPGDFFGYLAMFEEADYSESALAIEEVKVHAIPKNEFFDLLNSNSAVAGKFIRILANQLTENEEKLISIAYDSVRKRIAEALVDVYRSYAIHNNSKEIEISRQELASYVGTATETVIRTLSSFKSEGLIEIVQGNIKVVNLAGLISMRN